MGPAAWTAMHTVMYWFLNFTKYPPSARFPAADAGHCLAVAAPPSTYADERTDSGLATFGSAPMFFYLLHLYVLLVLQSLAVDAGGRQPWRPVRSGHIYWIWIGAVLLTSALYLPAPVRWRPCDRHVEQGMVSVASPVLRRLPRRACRSAALAQRLVTPLKPFRIPSARRVRATSMRRREPEPAMSVSLRQASRWPFSW